MEGGFFGAKGPLLDVSLQAGMPDGKIDPIFILFLDALAQLVSMNPFAFEYTSSYLAFIASELHSNRFFEFT